MPLYSYECEKKDCRHVFDDVRPMAQSEKPNKCVLCKSKAKRIITLRGSEPTFSEKLYANGGFYHSGIGEVVQSEKHLNQRCNELGFISKHEGASMTHKQERLLMSKRTSNGPKEIVQRPTWSGKGACAPTLEFYDK